MSNYYKWAEIYYNKKIININDYFDSKDFEVLDKLGVKIEDYYCTENQFDIIKHQIYEYYIDEEELPEIQEEIRKYSKSLETAEVMQEEYNALLKKIEIIDEVIYRKL